MKTIREGTRRLVSFIFEEEQGRSRFRPASIRYRLDDSTSGRLTEIIAWTDLSPAESVDIAIPSTANRILNDNNRYETRVLTVQSDYDTDDQLSQDEEYRVQNLKGFT